MPNGNACLGGCERSRATAFQAENIVHGIPLEGVSPSTAGFPCTRYIDAIRSYRRQSSSSGFKRTLMMKAGSPATQCP